MKIISRMSLIGLLAVVFSGCAFTPQQADITPDLQLVQTNEGNGTRVHLRVQDERPNQIIGRRGTGAMKGAEITSTQDLAVVFHDAIKEGLEKKGFAVVLDEHQAHDLKIEIRSFEYDVSMGFWTGGVHTNAAIKAIAERGDDDYENIYRYEGEKRVMVVPGKDKNQQLINQMANGVLTEFFNEKALITFLGQ